MIADRDILDLNAHLSAPCLFRDIESFKVNVNPKCSSCKPSRRAEFDHVTQYN